MEKKEMQNYAPSGLIDNGFVTPEVCEALSEGVGSTAIGFNSIAVGSTYKLLNITTMETPKKPDSIDRADWNDMSRSERISACEGEMTKSLSFNTNSGTLSLSSLFGENGINTSKYWDKAEVLKDTANTDCEIEVADGFDPTKVWRPSCMVPKLWIKNGCDNMSLQTVKCVAKRERTFKSRNGETFTIRTYAFEQV